MQVKYMFSKVCCCKNVLFYFILIYYNKLKPENILFVKKCVGTKNYFFAIILFLYKLAVMK